MLSFSVNSTIELNLTALLWRYVEKNVGMIRKAVSLNVPGYVQDRKGVIDAQVDVNRIDDSTYHFNLGDGSSCFKLELANDTLTVYMVNVMLCHINNDTITVITMRNKAEHEYQFNYSHYFNGSVPEKSKVKFIHN